MNIALKYALVDQHEPAYRVAQESRVGKNTEAQRIRYSS